MRPPIRTASFPGQAWTSDGTAAGTAPATNSAAIDYQPHEGFVGLGPKVYFIGYSDPAFDTSLYASDGSSITPVTNAAGQPTEADDAVIFNNLLYFFGTSGTAVNLWKTDGTSAGTTVVSAALTASASFGHLQTAGSTLFAEGVVSGIDQLFGVSPSNQITQLTNFTTSFNILGSTTIDGGTIYFVIDDAGGEQLWQSDGTVTGTALVKQLTTGETQAGLVQIASSAGLIYLTVKDPTDAGSVDLFKSDGTAAGTVLLKVVPVTAESSDAMVSKNGRVFFSGNGAAGGLSSSVLWFSDGTPGGTLSLMPGVTVAPNIGSLVGVGNGVYFNATDNAHGAELWSSDGTVAGTHLAIDIRPGFAGSNPFALAQISGVLYMAADDGVHGTELIKVYDQDVINGTAGADTIKLVADADGVSIDWSTSSSGSGQVPINDPDGLAINGNGGVDSLIIAGNGALPNSLHLNGTFTITGLTGTNPLAATSLDINASTIFITYTAGLDPLAAFRADLRNAYNGGRWSGVGAER